MAHLISNPPIEFVFLRVHSWFPSEFLRLNPEIREPKSSLPPFTSVESNSSVLLVLVIREKAGCPASGDNRRRGYGDELERERIRDDPFLVRLHFDVGPSLAVGL